MTKNEQKIAMLIQRQQEHDVELKRLKGKLLAVEREFGRYEAEYRAYLKKQHRIADWFESLYIKITRKKPRTKREITRKVQKRMARIFYKGGRA